MAFFLPITSGILYHAPAMPKMKTHNGTKKRTRRTGSGRIVVKKACKNHLLQQKSKRQKRLSRTLTPSCNKELKNLARLIPNK